LLPPLFKTPAQLPKRSCSHVSVGCFFSIHRAMEIITPGIYRSHSFADGTQWIPHQRLILAVSLDF
jgi:hypothetical protein